MATAPSQGQWSYVPIGQVTPNPDNPRTIKDAKFKQLVQSIRDLPQMLELRPIVVNAAGVVLGGNMRLRACKEAGLKQVPVIRADHLTEAQQREFVVKDNVGFGEWDWDALANEWGDEPLAEWGLDVPVVEADAVAGLTDPDAVPAPPAEPITRLGDLWLLGKHRLLCGDATSDKDVARLMNATKAGAVVTDPPYGIGIDGQKESICADPKHNRKAHEFMGWDSDRPPKAVFERVAAMQCPAAIFGGNYFADMLPASRGWVYWSKGQDGLTMSDGELVWTNTSKPLRCVTVNRGALRGSVHPTQKPVDVVAFVVKYLEPDDGPLVDFFLGSGTTLIVAEQLGRDCYGMEMEPKYCDAIVKRWEEFTGKQATRVGA